MAYDQRKDRVFLEKETPVINDTQIVGRVHSYNNSEPKMSLYKRTINTAKNQSFMRGLNGFTLSEWTRAVPIIKELQPVLVQAEKAFTEAKTAKQIVQPISFATPQPVKADTTPVVNFSF